MVSGKEKELFNRLDKHPTCKECFCNDLCMFLLSRTGVATSCADFRERVGRVVDREMDKLAERNNG
jgi:hypothetical protein